MLFRSASARPSSPRITPASGSRPIVAYAHSAFATFCALNVPATVSSPIPKAEPEPGLCHRRAEQRSVSIHGPSHNTSQARTGHRGTPKGRAPEGLFEGTSESAWASEARFCSLRTINTGGHERTTTPTRVHTQRLHRASTILPSRTRIAERSGTSQYHPCVSSLHDCQDFTCS